MPGLNLLIYIERVPNDSTSLVTAVSTPAMIEAISITVTTPMITPMTVRNERSLLARRVPKAIQRFSRISERNIFITDLDDWSASFLGCNSVEQARTLALQSLQNLRFSAQRFNRIETRCFPGREQPGQNSKSTGDADRDGYRPHRQV